MVFQNYALYPHMTVRQNIGFALENKKIPAAERDRRVRAAADVLGLTELLSGSPGSCLAGSASAWPWDGRSSASLRYS